MPFSKQLEKIMQGKIWRFFGGIKTVERKGTTNSAIEELAIPSLITLPLDRHLGEGGHLLVHTGDRVKAGQRLTTPGGNRNVPLHASTSGEVISIGMQVLPHPSGFLGRCITIKPDGLDEKVPDEPMTDWKERTPKELLDRIRLFGVEGLGGAQFQTAAKIGAAVEEARGDCNIFIVNGAECEPVATCDDRLMQERAAEIAQGIEVVRHILKPKVIIVAIENNKPNAIKAMKAAVASDVQVREIPSLYPSGAARNLIKICTGIEIPYSEHTSECGIVVDNVETVFAIKQAVIDGIPLIKRVITVDGQTLGRSGNALVRLGTSVRFVLNSYKLNPERRQRVILGGPFMGFTLPSIDVPITKSATCVYVPSYKELDEQPESMNCIRCGRCARVCPSRLVPYQLYALSRAGMHKKTSSCGMMDCTECGCCSYVCPSRITLTAQFRKEKAILRLLDDNQKRNQRAQERIAARNERLAKEEETRRKRREAALARAAREKEAEADMTPEQIAQKRAEAVAAARERAAARRAAAVGNTAVGGAAGAAAREKAAQPSGNDMLVRPQGDSSATMGSITAIKAISSISPAGAASTADDAADSTAGNLAASTAQERASRMMQQRPDGMLVAAMMAQGGTTAMRQRAEENGIADSSRAAGKPVAASDDANAEQREKLPYSLRKGARQKHAPDIHMWPAITEREPCMDKVENPPAEGVYIPESRPKTKMYLQAPEEKKKENLKLPGALRRADLPPAGEENQTDNSDSAGTTS